MPIELKEGDISFCTFCQDNHFNCVVGLKYENMDYVTWRVQIIKKWNTRTGDTIFMTSFSCDCYTALLKPLSPEELLDI
jgi:hypothetical protein